MVPLDTPDSMNNTNNDLDDTTTFTTATATDSEDDLGSSRSSRSSGANDDDNSIDQQLDEGTQLLTSSDNTHRLDDPISSTANNSPKSQAPLIELAHLLNFLGPPFQLSPLLSSPPPPLNLKEIGFTLHILLSPFSIANLPNRQQLFSSSLPLLFSLPFFLLFDDRREKSGKNIKDIWEYAETA